MLPPDSRTTLLAHLVPPPGSTLEHLVATTFTLDLESALLPSLALAGSANVEAADRVETVAAIRASVNRIDIFHQAGQVAVPRDRSPLFSLLEKSVHGIAHPRGLFHPKLWLGRYNTESGEQFVRLIVMSRNLTKDRSWDVALTLDGWITTAPRASNRPLVDLLRYLPAAAVSSPDQPRVERINTLAEAIRYAEWELPPGVSDLNFHIYGLVGKPQPIPDFSGYRHLLVSPFLQDGGLEHLSRVARGPLTVVSRQESLNSLTEEWAEWVSDAYVLSPTAGIPADTEENPASSTLFTGLHAKLYVIERARMAHLFIGSANATSAAFNVNVEILVELTGQVKTYGAGALLDSNGGFGSILEAAEIVPDTSTEDDPQLALDSVVRSLAAVPLTAQMTLTDEDTASLCVTSNDAMSYPGSEVVVRVSLLTDPSTASELSPGSKVDVEFVDLCLNDVTAFMVLSAEDSLGRISATVVKADLLGDVPRRLNDIVTNEITNSDQFRRLLALLLAFGTPVGEKPSPKNGSGSAGGWNHVDQGMFEQMLKASVAEPEVLGHLSGVVASIIDRGDPHQVLPEGFEHLWKAIVEATDLEGVVSGE